MVMKRNAMRKNLLQSILKSFGRYIAIVAIIALGASMFVGLLMTKTDMVATGQKFMDEQNMFDLRLISTYGWAEEQLAAIRKLDCVADAEGVIYVDAVARTVGGEDDSVYRFYAIPDRMNLLSIRGGRMPESADECVIVGYQMTDDILGTQISVSAQNDDTTLETLRYRTYTVVGYVATPMYMDMNRGTTSVGSGSLANCLYVPIEGMDTDVYSEINLTITGDYEVYSEEYNDAMKEIADMLEPIALELGQERFSQLRRDAFQTYREGRQEYLDGLNEYRKAKADAMQELEDAYAQLVEAQELIAENEKMIIDGEQQLASGKAQLAAGIQELEAGKAEYEEMKATIDTVAVEGMQVLLDRREELVEQIAQIDAEIARIDAQLNADGNAGSEELSEIDRRIAELDGLIEATDVAIQAAEYSLQMMQQYPGTPAEMITQAQNALTQLNSQLQGYEQERHDLIDQRDELVNPDGTDSDYQTLLDRKNELLSERAFYQSTLDGVELAIERADSTMAGVMDMLAEAEAEIFAGEQQISAAQAQIAQAEKELADGKIQLEEGKIELAEGWIEYEEGKADAEAEFLKAEEKLAEGKAELDDGLLQIADMNDVDVFVLDRNSNIGYGSLDSASDIVQGVSRVFPAFFLLVAALVCITTMTRMIDEERTQIGTLKALGYSNAAIISKYLIYAGSGAVLGCGLGVFVGSMAFPTILWQAYKIMLYITDGIVLKFNLQLCGIVVFAYTAVMLFVTWYCCRNALKEVPAELIRPKAPDAGKKILMEMLPFWNRISFLNKVTIRNIFRYRQRLAMMMVGIGGCTALLVTGFGLRDSIVNVVEYQFQDVTSYDLQVYFTGHQSEGDRYQFEGVVQGLADNLMFYHQESVEIETPDQTKEILLMAADPDIQDFIDFHKGDESISMPRANEVLLTVGVCEAMGIRVGDQITMRNADMQRLNLTVSGIYDNHVENYAIILPDTIEAQWGMEPDMQMAMVKVAEGQDIYSLSAAIMDMKGVMNVSVSEDFAGMVSNMMKALDLVVWVIVFCAGLLAAIVLYNLTNININERIREIATIKVLGFNSGETGAYVFKENLSLTVIGSIAGLGLGYLLLLFVMSQIKIDMVWFKCMVMPQSYFWAIGLTILSACIVDFVFYFKLEKINMAEALKSVE